MVVFAPNCPARSRVKADTSSEQTMFLFLKGPADIPAAIPFGQSAQLIKAIRRSMALIEFTPDGNILAASEPFCRLMGYQEDDLLGKHHRIFCTAEHAASGAYQAFWQSLAAGKGLSDRFSRVDSQGREIWLEVLRGLVCGFSGIRSLLA